MDQKFDIFGQVDSKKSWPKPFPIYIGNVLGQPFWNLIMSYLVIFDFKKSWPKTFPIYIGNVLGQPILKKNQLTIPPDPSRVYIYTRRVRGYCELIFFQNGLTQNVSYIYRKRFGSTLFEIENYQITHDQISKGLTQNVSYIYRKRFGSTLFGINLAKNVEFLVHFYFTSSTFASLAQIFF